MSPRRSTIVVPAHSERFISKAIDFEADVVVLDLEDTVPDIDAAKKAARNNAVAALRNGKFRAREISVRINGPRTSWFRDDIGAVSAAGAHSISLPHCFNTADVLAAAEVVTASGRTIPIQLSVETPGLLLELEDVARQVRSVAGLAVAPNDYTLETGSSALIGALMQGHPGIVADEQIVWLRHKVLAVARAVGWSAIDALVVSDPRNDASVGEAMRRSRALGFDGCAVMYPAHIALANEVFGPSSSELAWAADVVARYEAMRRTEAMPPSDKPPVLRQHYELARRMRALADSIGAGP